MNKGQGPSEMLCGEFIEKRMRQRLQIQDEVYEPPYVFDRYSMLMGRPGVEVTVPELIRRWNTSAFTPESAKPIVMIGGPGSGVGFHRHAAAFQYLVHGKKRWWMYPIGQDPPGGIHGSWGIQDWVDKVHPHLLDDMKPLECMQSEGDLIFVPEGFSHAVLNLADSVSMSIQEDHVFTSGLQVEFAARSAARVHEHTADLKWLLKQWPRSTETKLTLFRATRKKGKRAARYLREALRHDPWLSDAQYLLADLLGERARKGDQAAGEDLLSLLESWESYLQENPRNAQCTHMLAQLHLLRGDIDLGRAAIRKIILRQQGGVEDLRPLPDFAGILRALPIG